MPIHQEVQMVCTVWRKAEGKGKKGDSKGWNDSKGWTAGKGWSQGKVGTRQVKVGSNKRPAGMNNLERDSMQYDVIVVETSPQEKTVRDSDWCVLDINQGKHQILC